jgi:hypothetical protein
MAPDPFRSPTPHLAPKPILLIPRIGHLPVCDVWSADASVMSPNEILMSLASPQDSPDIYVLAVLGMYVELPDTPSRASPLDEACARRFFQGNIPFEVIETALLLASLRRRERSPNAPPLPGIRSLAYFQPIIDELLQTPISDSYRAALRLKLQRLRERQQA